MKTLLEVLCEAARRHPRHLRDSDLNSMAWFPDGRPELNLPDLSFLLFGVSSTTKGY